MFLEATTVISKRPYDSRNGTQKTKRLCHHCNSHIIVGTIFTVAMMQGYDSAERQEKRTEGKCLKPLKSISSSIFIQILFIHCLEL